jgi:hypothetical protein
VNSRFCVEVWIWPTRHRCLAVLGKGPVTAPEGSQFAPYTLSRRSVRQAGYEVKADVEIPVEALRSSTIGCVDAEFLVNRCMADIAPRSTARAAPCQQRVSQLTVGRMVSLQTSSLVRSVLCAPKSS